MDNLTTRVSAVAATGQQQQQAAVAAAVRAGKHRLLGALASDQPLFAWQQQWQSKNTLTTS
jgi:hypothetical protein